MKKINTVIYNKILKIQVITSIIILKVRVLIMKNDINLMLEEEFKIFLRTTEEGKELKKKAMEAFMKSQIKNKSKEQ